MIKCNVTVCGTISRSAQMRTNKEGKSFIAFGVSVVIPAKEGINKTVEVSVAKESADQQELANYPAGARVEMTGTLFFHKKGDALYFNMSATGVNTFDAGDEDCIKGEMEFRGTLGKNIEAKTDKKGKPFCAFSAFSSEKVDDGYEYTWVRFLHFGEEKKDWMQPKAGINVKGELQISMFKDRLDLSCRVKELSEWQKPQRNN